MNEPIWSMCGCCADARIGTLDVGAGVTVVIRDFDGDVYVIHSHRDGQLLDFPVRAPDWRPVAQAIQQARSA